MSASAFGTLIDENPATCIAGGMKAHYKCTVCGKFFDEDKNETTKAALTIPATGVHNYGAWVSNGDGTHTRTCTTGSHSETENCSGGTATCENKAVCEVCGEEYGDIPGHNYGEVTYTWTSDNKCKAERVCTHDNTHIESETVTATAINHITNEMISTAPPEKRAFSDLISFWGDVLDTRTILCAHNARFDMDFLSETLMRLGYDGKIKYIDTLRLSKNMIYGVENHKQQTLANYFGIVNSHEHRATSDAKVCGEILLKLIDMKNEEAERKEREINNVKERIRLLQNEYQNMQAQLTINPINSRVSLQDIKNLNNQGKGFDKGIAYWEQGESLRKAESIEAAIKLFDEARYNGYCAPALYESYAMAYHKIKDLDNEIDILNEGIERLDDSIYVCEKLMIRRNKAVHMLIKKLDQQRERQFKEMKRQEKEDQKEQAANKPKKVQGRAILKLSDDMELIERYETVASAARENGISPKNIRDAANGVYKHAGGFVWRYADESNSEYHGNE